MKNITVTVDDETYLEARVWAARRSTSVSALVRRFLETLDDPPRLYLDLPDGDLDTPPPPPLFPVKL
jgi:hypothetical protein